MPTPKSSSSPAKKRSAYKIKLPSNFVPGKYTVLCGRGKLCSESPGNKHLRSLVHGFLTPYSMARNKSAKSAIVSAIIQYIRQASPHDGIFVKEGTSSDGQSVWWEVDDSFAREKIGCMFRDTLHTQYKSSTKAKHERKMREENASLYQETERQLQQINRVLASSSSGPLPSSSLMASILHPPAPSSDTFSLTQPMKAHSSSGFNISTTSSGNGGGNRKTATAEEATLFLVEEAWQIISMDHDNNRDIILDLPPAGDLSTIFD